ncbi:class I SAM-dependent methyltransferase [Dolichospermum sp. LEGE 00240]|jgi:SAM-dependent MidA family methyltransferase|uniref:class I SAM-dependent methyltransferase n=1 Tax=Dolichospermum sp. LEGE 00240 TaxID=1828603 RepID=UPI001882F56C|nr:class I SAM-dependent methyltransferase [Dolichospermum sp. LEGE 00240]MDM3845255.1 class I SAM-dependent methyltransferase [Aphanizomenon gracile PMC638.10]MDM3849682.1 class I SAM-dependent methyltransferase [Aphanizomenon gracile PMC627.10]MDM3854713.1 class I SAM-dependent methyltransferase [Aphanizomenon gracile PMC649.10]MDM3859290.1 class I SAM-dependent methyltransferase [Aphanizomenon gracile PMC644.10]MBE9248546.1 class I SAM-dependent methyltransferase [Dolichospermum sp. LEGE 00
MDSHSPLCQAITHRIITSPQKRITFAQYMEMVLYHPEYGYYSSDAIKIGFRGSDFFTSASLGADFGELLAKQFYQMWEILDQPIHFDLVEMGAGQGILASHILNYIQQESPDFFGAVKYIIVEKSQSLKQQQQQRLQDFAVNWCNLEEIPSKSINGCFFSNELVDAFPVHQFILAAGELREIYVTLAELNREISEIQIIRDPLFMEVIGEPSTPQLGEYFKLVGIDLSQNTYENGYRSEINLAALNWLGIVADCLERGYVLTIDYGYPAHRYYNPRRSQGTLQCYYQHRHHDNPYINIGQQDITAHVDFTALSSWGERCGLKQVGWTQQGLFLMALGIGERIAALSSQQQPISQLLQRREGLHQLINPSGLGNFGVLVQSQGLTEKQASQPLQGLVVPE